VLDRSPRVITSSFQIGRRSGVVVGGISKAACPADFGVSEYSVPLPAKGADVDATHVSENGLNACAATVR